MDDRRSLEHEGEQQRHRRLGRAGARPQGGNNPHPAMMLTPQGIETPAQFFERRAFPSKQNCSRALSIAK
jgi:hypothetical protein